MAYKERERKDVLLILQELEKGKKTEPSWQEMNQLTDLWLQSRQMTSLPSSISSCSNLQYLNLSWNHLTHLPDSISQLKHLRKFDLGHNDFKEFPTQICSLSELKELNIRNNKLTSLHPDVNKLTNLMYLDLGSNQFIDFPAEVCHIPELETLNIYQNKISSVHPDVTKMTKLTKLDLGCNEFTDFPAGVCNIPELKILGMNRNKISSVHPDVIKMTKLTNLDLEKNQFTDFPAEVCNIPELKILGMNRNKISSVHPDVIKMTKLTNLDLDQNQFTDFPAEVCHISELETLKMNWNKISSVHPYVINMTKLTKLDLGSNEFTDFPAEVCNIPELKILGMNWNKISNVHPDVIKMTKLTNLELSENKFTDFPAELLLFFTDGSSSKGSKLASSLDRRQAGQSMSDTADTSALCKKPKPAEKLLKCKVPDFISKEVLEKITRDLVPRDIRKEMGAAIQKHSVSLQQRYPNISRISISRIQADGAGEKKPCIAVYCSDITNMAHFPEKFEGYPVEVREGTFSLNADNEGSRDNDHSQLHIGCSVASSSQLQGSLGVFVNHHRGGHASAQPQAFVTCAHVVCPYSKEAETAINKSVYVENNQTWKKCGFVSKCYVGDVKLDNGFGSERSYGVDIALVELNKNAEANLFPIQSQQTSFSDVDIRDVEDIYNDEENPILVHKFGATTGLTHGAVSFEYDYCRDIELIDGVPSVTKSLSNMITVLSIPTLDKPTFSKKGDSGSAVYVELENGKKVIIGILVGSASDTSGEVPVHCGIVSRIHPSLHQMQACLY
ncbi:leucine-rich repeat and IQ domain-containing protein 4 [Lingula anatina]|uniref:Leucine-rich repeat and IQ domain-containing protein 4 n=1 Tax=Lingula anatina TaxID=7574 RepID=A0A1S3ICN7_LINAN|nr:leucine-rich repeat and IQ domain-containing protein 4 [Lingula anatina]|eukprot:XP_013395621.1 leucine-rich repeat and IQ domain-containing protein 4 [Lingula anatina]